MKKELKALLEEAGFEVKIMPRHNGMFSEIKGLIINNNIKFIYETEEDGTVMIRQIQVAKDYLNLGYTTRLLEFLSKQNEYNVILPFVTTPKLAHICDKLGIKRDDSCIEKYGYDSAFYSIAKNYAFYEGKYGHYVVRQLDI